MPTRNTIGNEDRDGFEESEAQQESERIFEYEDEGITLKKH